MAGKRQSNPKAVDNCKSVRKRGSAKQFTTKDPSKMIRRSSSRIQPKQKQIAIEDRRLNSRHLGESINNWDPKVMRSALRQVKLEKKTSYRGKILSKYLMTILSHMVYIAMIDLSAFRFRSSNKRLPLDYELQCLVAQSIYLLMRNANS